MAIAIYFILLMAILPWQSTEALPLPHHSARISKRSYFDINCRGLYDRTIFARLDRVCQDCYSLYREPELHTLCRSDCFSSAFFKACLKVLLIDHQEAEYGDMAHSIGRK